MLIPEAAHMLAISTPGSSPRIGHPWVRGPDFMTLFRSMALTFLEPLPSVSPSTPLTHLLQYLWACFSILQFHRATVHF